MNLQDLFPPPNIGERDHHLPIEAPRAQQRRVEDVGAVGGRNNNDPVIGLEAVHLHQKLVERLFPLVVTAPETGAPVPAHGIDFIDENNARRLLLGLLKHVTNAGGAHANEHFHEVRARNREEGHLRLPRNGLRQQGFTRTRGTHHQHPPRNMAAQALKLPGIAEKLHKLLDVILRLVHPRHVGKGSFDLVFAKQASLGLPETHGAAPAAGATLHLAHKEHENGDDHQNGETGHQKLTPKGLLLRPRPLHGDAVGDQVVHQLRIVDLGPDRFEMVSIAELAANDEAVDHHFPNSVTLDRFHKLRIEQLLGGGLRAEVVEDGQQHCGNDEPQQQVLAHIVQGSYLALVRGDPNGAARRWGYGTGGKQLQAPAQAPAPVLNARPYSLGAQGASFVTDCIVLSAAPRRRRIPLEIEGVRPWAFGPSP